MIGLDLDNQILNDRFELFGRVGAEVGEDLFVAGDIRAQANTVLVRMAYNPQGISQAAPDSRAELLSGEFKLANSIEHPNVVAVLESGQAVDRAGSEFDYLVYEYLAGGDFGDLCRRQPEGRLSLIDLVRFLRQVCGALSLAHQHGIFHGHLRTSHLLLTADERTMKVGGLGRSKPRQFDEIVIDGLQSDAFAAPAHATSGDDNPDPVKRANDVYALAKICFMGLTGHTPLECIGRPIDRLPTPISGEPGAAELVRILSRATAASPSDRYDSASAFSRDLADLAESVNAAKPKVERKPSPEEKELVRKRAQFAPIKAVLAQRELELATLKVEMREFEGRYLRVVGTKHAELDELEAQIAEANARHFPDDVELRIAAQRARTRASESAEAAKRHASTGEPCETFEPSDRLKQIYRELARLIHPDTVLDREQKETRHVLMSQVNQAYEANDFGRLQNLLGDWEHSPEAVKGHGPGAELIRTIRRIDQAEERLDLISSEMKEEERSHVFELKRQTDAALNEGRDHLMEMATRLDYRISEARRRLHEFQPEFSR